MFQSKAFNYVLLVLIGAAAITLWFAALEGFV